MTTSPNDNFLLKDGSDVPFKLRSKDTSTLQDGSLHTVRHLATPFPIDYGSGGCFHAAVKSGAMAAGMTANSPILAFRNTSPLLVSLLRRVRFAAWSTATGFTSGLATLEMYVARSFTVMDTGGAAVTLTSPQTKLLAAMGAPQSAIQTSTTISLTSGTRTKDTLPVEAMNVNVSAATNTPFIGGSSGPAKLFEKLAGDHPLAMVQNEGFVLQASVPATGTWAWSAAIEWDEVPLQNF